MSPELKESIERADEYVGYGHEMLKMDARDSIIQADYRSEVYFLEESGMGAIKIGVTGNLEYRLTSIRCSTPHFVEVIASVHADVRFERYLLSRFAHARVRGEWFYPVPELVEYIKKTGHELAPCENKLTHEERVKLSKILVDDIDEAFLKRFEAEHPAKKDSE